MGDLDRALSRQPEAGRSGSRRDVLPAGRWGSRASSGRAHVAHCHLGLGELCRRIGDQAQAAEHLASSFIAATMYGEVGMTFWLEQAEAALGRPHRNSP
jgi:hypothetical protein